LGLQWVKNENETSNMRSYMTTVFIGKEKSLCITVWHQVTAGFVDEGRKARPGALVGHYKFIRNHKNVGGICVCGGWVTSWKSSRILFSSLIRLYLQRPEIDDTIRSFFD
jgi:hypothetical protein